jgi:tRNA pseudouridine13 synthase
MTAPRHEPAERERRALENWQISAADFTRFSKLTRGTRRSLLVWPEELSLKREGDALRLKFQLPSGAYATTLLREFMKD